MLGNRHKRGLMVGSRVYRSQPIYASRETLSNSGSKDTILGCSVQPQEECEFRRVCWRGLLQRGDGLDDDVRVSDYQALSVNLLGRGEIIGLRIHEVAGFHTLNIHGDSERCISFEGVQVLRV